MPDLDHSRRDRGDHELVGFLFRDRQHDANFFRAVRDIGELPRLLPIAGKPGECPVGIVDIDDQQHLTNPADANLRRIETADGRGAKEGRHVSIGRQEPG